MKYSDMHGNTHYEMDIEIGLYNTKTGHYLDAQEAINLGIKPVYTIGDYVAIGGFAVAFLALTTVTFVMCYSQDFYQFVSQLK